MLQYGMGEKPGYGKIWAYEVDGFGNQLFMDDANVPSLLSLPYLGCCETSDPIYLATRRFVLSHDNPYFYRGALAEGIGGPHIVITPGVFHSIPAPVVAAACALKLKAPAAIV